MIYYEAGDIVTIRGTEDRELQRAHVLARVDSIRDGQPGFIGETTDGARTWGYDVEIVDVSPTVVERRQQKITDLRVAAESVDRQGGYSEAEAYRREADRLEDQAAEQA